MSDEWQYQIRIYLDDDLAALARGDPGNTAVRPLAEVLDKHQATIKCQFDAFADYVAEAEKHGTENYPLYKWTKATIEDPVKKAKYISSFTLHIGGDEIYARANADALEADLQALVVSGLIARMSKHDTNPANNPQAPARYR